MLSHNQTIVPGRTDMNLKAIQPTPSNLGRREFLGVCGLATAGALAGVDLFAAERVGARKLKDIGIIGGVPKDAGADWQASLRKMAEFGYTVLEGGLRGDSPGAYLKFLRETGLKLVSCGVQFGKQLKPDWLANATALHAEYATTFWPWFYAPETLTLDQLKEIADQLNRAGEQCKAAGLKFAVHNHDRDFRVIDGKPIFDRLLDLTDPGLVTVELDIYWAIKAGVDPLEYFKRYPGRFPLFHVKDMGPAPERGFVTVGAGTIDFRPIFAQSELAGAKHYIVELEGSSNTMKSAEESCRFLRQLRF